MQEYRAEKAILQGGMGMSWGQIVKEKFFTYGEPCFDYTRAFWLGIIYLLGLTITVMMAYGFSFRASINIPHHVGLTIALILLSLLLQTLRESGLTKRTEDAEAKAERKQAEYEAKQNDMAEKQKELNDLAETMNQSQKDLTDLLKTMPPPHALSSFTVSYQFVLQLWRSRGPEPKSIAEAERTIEKYEEWIRVCLNAIARLFLQYEHKPMTSKCTAHFAQFMPVDDIEADCDLKRRVLNGLRFVDHPNDPLYGLEGVLCVCPALSAFSEPKNETSSNPDPNLKEEIFLPIPTDEAAVGGRTRFLPIAPQAFKYGLVNMPDVSTAITREASRNWNVTQDVIDQVLAYFNGHEHGRKASVVGYRLIWDDSDPTDENGQSAEAGGVKLGVLTLFTEMPDSKENSVLSSFFDLVRPLVEMQKTLILAIMETREKLGNSEYEPDSPVGD